MVISFIFSPLIQYFQQLNRSCTQSLPSLKSKRQSKLPSGGWLRAPARPTAELQLSASVYGAVFLWSVWSLTCPRGPVKISSTGLPRHAALKTTKPEVAHLSSSDGTAGAPNLCSRTQGRPGISLWICSTLCLSVRLWVVLGRPEPCAAFFGLSE